MLTSLIFLALLGAILGSFMNALIYRDKHNLSLGGRSMCIECKHNLTYIDLFPIASYVILRGKCRFCKEEISSRYFFVEVASVLSFILAGVVYAADPILIIPHSIFLLFLIGVLARDIDDFIIPDKFSIILGVVAIVITILEDRLLESLIYGPLFALPFFILWFVSEGRWMGLGDAKLAISIGWVATTNLIFIFFASFFVGLFIVGIIYLFDRVQRNTMSLKSEIPFAPSIILSFITINYIGITNDALVNAILLL